MQMTRAVCLKSPPSKCLIHYIGSVSSVPFNFVSITLCSTCDVFQQSYDKMSRLDSKNGIKSCIYFYGGTNNSIWIGFLRSKTNELLNRLDLGLPKSDSCQIAACGPESTAWVSKTMACAIFSVSFPGAVSSVILEYSN